MPDYPWYGIVNGDTIEQGDILRRCRVILPVTPVTAGDSTAEEQTVEFDQIERDVVIISQTCDLVKGREKV